MVKLIYMKNILLLLFLTLPIAQVSAKEASQNTQAQIPVLWKLERQPPVWLFGTIHLPDPRVNQLSLVPKLLFDKSDVVLTEIPIEFADITLAQLKMKRNDGKSLPDILPESLYHRLDLYLEKLSVLGGATLMKPLKTWAVYASLPLLEAQMKHPLTKPLDFNIYQSAKQNGKQVGGLETTIEQLGYFDQFTEKEQITMLDETLTILEEEQLTGESYVEKMLQWYIAGAKTDIRQLMEELSPQNRSIELEEKFLDILLTQRNELMAERLVNWMKKEPDKQFFVAVGAGHLSSEKNIPYFLEKLGVGSRRFLSSD